MVSGFETAVERHQRRIYTFARYYLGNSQEADDITQEVLLKLWRKRREIDDERMLPWLVRVTRNACYDLLRKRRSAAKMFSSEAEDEAVQASTDPEPGPEARAEASDFKRHLEDALDEIGEPYKSLVLLREVQGMKYQEISDALEMPLNTVRVYLHRARHELRERLREVYEHVTIA